MDFEIEFSPKSEDDLRFIIEYYKELSLSTTKKYYYGILERVENLTKYPKIGRPVPEFIDIFHEYKVKTLFYLVYCKRYDCYGNWYLFNW